MKEEIVSLDYKNKKINIACNFSRGNNESIVFIHGMGCSKEFFSGAWKSRLFNNYSVLAFDSAGFGNSSRPKELECTTEDHAEICALLINKLSLKNINLVGHSFGGAISLLLIRKIPSKISSFVNLEGNLIAEDCTMSRDIAGYSLNEFQKHGYKKIISEIRKQKDLLNSQKATSMWQESMHMASPQALYISSASLVRWSESGKLLKMFEDLKIKKCYIHGALNRDLAVLNRLSGIKKFSISKSGHFMMIDNPKEFYQVLGDFIKNRK
ncbi:alpha/beta hydrolase [Candidatus Woesearchaeota archaeon]|nr:alpha/beta hydrolase [Candidatus Woesearchaeota archaeon]